MSFHITFEPLNHIPGVKPKTVTIDTATKAWAEVQSLVASDEKVKIFIDGGMEITLQELKHLAEKEAH